MHAYIEDSFRLNRSTGCMVTIICSRAICLPRYLVGVQYIRNQWHLMHFLAHWTYLLYTTMGCFIYTGDSSNSSSITVVHLQVLQRPSVEFSVIFFLLHCTHQTQFDFSKKSLLQSKLTQYVCKLNLETIFKIWIYLIYILEQSRIAITKYKIKLLIQWT